MMGSGQHAPDHLVPSAFHATIARAGRAEIASSCSLRRRGDRKSPEPIVMARTTLRCARIIRVVPRHASSGPGRSVPRSRPLIRCLRRWAMRSRDRWPLALEPGHARSTPRAQWSSSAERQPGLIPPATLKRDRSARVDDVGSRRHDRPIAPADVATHGWSKRTSTRAHGPMTQSHRAAGRHRQWTGRAKNKKKPLTCCSGSSLSRAHRDG